ncbi:MAG: acetylornithine/succinylornithine family transaminase [Herpetosiphonaceae bacterium]|nr:acetylornithine/succinylornithine family transaminase [Herpetosiphonaceae bacterium]
MTITETTTETSYADLEQAHTSGVYSKRPLTIVRGAGATLYDEAGRAYLDCGAGIGVANIGHCHPAVVAAITAQAATLTICQEAFHNDQRALLQAELAAVLPAGMERIFLCNSGTEAVEAAIKFARLATGRPGIIAAMRGFHGRTFGALSATWEAHYREPFAPLVPEFSHIPYNNLARLESAITPATAAVLLEVVQGEGGVRPGEAEFLRGAQRLCRERGILLILDEVQTGFGRTGKMFACEHFALEPDLLCLAKALGGGLPMGAVGIGRRIGELSVGSHGSTFGGNPLACAAARTSLQVLQDEHLAEQAAEKGAWLLARLRAIRSPRIREVRGLGLMIGIELKEKVAPYLQTLQNEHGIIALNAGTTVLRLLPPLVIGWDELERLALALEAGLG